MGVPRLTHQSLRVLKLFSEAPKVPRSGADIIAATGLASGTLYPILSRFETSGLLKSQWEKVPPTTLGRPRRRFYCITFAGREFTRKALAELK